jgi:Nucleotide-diphospho-sugar transferase
VDVKKLFLACSHVLARFGLWFPTVAILYFSGSINSLDKRAKGRLLYAVLMSSGDRRTQGMYVCMLRRDLDRSADGNFNLAAMAQCLARPQCATLIYRRTARQSHPANELQVAAVMANLTVAIASGSIYAHIAALVDGLGLEAGEDLVLVSTGRRYLEMFGLWFEQARKHVSGRIVGIALDTESEAALRDSLHGSVINLAPFFVFDEQGVLHARSRNGLWILRVLLVREMVSRGHRVISMDLDAMVLSDLEPMLTTFAEADIIAQQDYSIPVDVARKLGFVLCCGFMVFHPTAATKVFLDRYAKRTMQELDDQLAINHMIGEATISELTKAPSYFTFQSDGVSWLCPDKSLVSREISSGSCVRHFQQHGQTIAELRTQLGLQA